MYLKEQYMHKNQAIYVFFPIIVIITITKLDIGLVYLF